MADYRLDLIKQYFDTSGVRMHDHQKDLLFHILKNSVYYDGFESPVYEFFNSGRDYRGSWDSCTSDQYRININNNSMIILKRTTHQCDGICQNAHWDWSNAYCFNNIKDILRCLEEMKNDL